MEMDKKSRAPSGRAWAKPCSMQKLKIVMRLSVPLLPLRCPGDPCGRGREEEPTQLGLRVGCAEPAHHTAAPSSSCLSCDCWELSLTQVCFAFLRHSQGAVSWQHLQVCFHSLCEQLACRAAATLQRAASPGQRQWKIMVETSCSSGNAFQPGGFWAPALLLATWEGKSWQSNAQEHIP